MKVTVIPVVIGTLGTVLKGLKREAGRVGTQRLKRDHPNYSIVEVGQNTEKSPGSLRRLDDSSVRPSADANEKKLARNLIITIIIIPKVHGKETWGTGKQ